MPCLSKASIADRVSIGFYWTFGCCLPHICIQPVCHQHSNGPHDCRHPQSFFFGAKPRDLEEYPTNTPESKRNCEQPEERFTEGMVDPFASKAYRHAEAKQEARKINPICDHMKCVELPTPPSGQSPGVVPVDHKDAWRVIMSRILVNATKRTIHRAGHGPL